MIEGFDVQDDRGNFSGFPNETLLHIINFVPNRENLRISW